MRLAGNTYCEVYNMLKSTRKLFSLIASFVFLLCLVPSANATESESVVSFSYFYEALKDE